MTFSISARATLFAAIVLSGCGGSSTPSGGAVGPNGTNAATAQADTTSVETRLRGNWRITDFRSEVPLEPALQALLGMQFQTMIVRFEGGHVLADSPTIHVNRPFKITEAAGPDFKLVAVDESGNQSTSSCQFNDDSSQIIFHGETEPWRGTGTLRRQQ